MIINDLFNNKKPTVAESMAGKIVFSGTGANGSTYEIIQSSPTDFMIHANGRHIDTYGSLQRAMSVLQNEVPGLQQGMAEGMKSQDLAIYCEKLVAEKGWDAAYKHALMMANVGRNPAWNGVLKYLDAMKQGVAEAQTDYQKRRQRERDADAGKPVKPLPKNPQNDYFARRKKEKEQGVSENQDWMKDLAARAAAKSKPGTPYVPPKQDAEKQQRDLTAKYPNIDELVADAERNRDPYYDRAEGSAYYRGREAEQLYQRLKQIQRVIQGLNESPADTKKKELGTGTGRINPNTGRPWTPSELKAKYSDVDFDKEARTANLARLRDQAKQEKLKDKLKTSLDDPRDSTSNLAKSFVSKGGFGTDFKPPAPVPPSQRTVPPAPAPVTVQSQPPGFTASNLAQQPGMAQYMQQKPITPKPAPNFAQGPAGYKTATTNVPPVATTTTTPPVERNTSDILQALTKMGFKTKEAEAAINRLPPNISTKDAILQILRGKQMSESLTWSKNFDPGRSLYRRIKQES